MNIFASLITLLLIPVFEKLWSILQTSLTPDEAQLMTLELAISDNSQIFSVLSVSICMVCLAGIFLISNFIAEKDENSPWTKNKIPRGKPSR